MNLTRPLVRILQSFRLDEEKEDYQSVIENIEKGVVFKGTNLWVLVFAIFIASLGLNVNSTAVIIGAMLISPIMGPIMGLGLGMAINDLALLKKAWFNYLLAAGVSLATSTIYFLISPLNDAHSEILARTSPNIYDVLIAFFGGLAGILATSSRMKGNVIPGVAIATALMPPLCTAGYGLATWNLTYFFGAFYLFLINTVFIALSTLIIARFLKFPFRHLPDHKADLKAKRIVWAIVIITVLPSIYFGYDIVQQNRFTKQANAFIDNEAQLPNDYILKKEIDAEKKSITLVYGGQFIAEEQIKALNAKLTTYNIPQGTLKVKQGFAYLQESKNDKQPDQLTIALTDRDNQIKFLQSRLDSAAFEKSLRTQIYKELKVQYPSIQSCVLQPVTSISDSVQKQFWLCGITTSKKLEKDSEEKIASWLKVRLNTKEIVLSNINAPASAK